MRRYVAAAVATANRWIHGRPACRGAASIVVSTCSARFSCAALTSLGIVSEAHLGRFVGGDGHLGGLGSVAFLPGGQGVLAGRNAGELEVPVGPGDGEERIGVDDHVSRHPRVDVALELEDVAGVADLADD